MSKQAAIAVVDYGAGNLPNMVRALRSVGGDLVVTSDPKDVREARAVVFPGVGATLDTMQSLERLGMVDALREAAESGRPVLGVCVGMQVLCEASEEFGTHPCLGIVGGTVRALPTGQKVPQIGWNQVTLTEQGRGHPLFAGIEDGSDFYFVHSYFCDLSDPRMIGATTDYGVSFPSALVRENVAAVQFHPEKSGQLGLRLLANYVSWTQAWK
ncbi:imidazole glycerol phosphate synthase subunit HisH [Chloroflexia bacterium SDU3-3]|nr:imidazole glycerol phosphate synthase subunit HisH [Chloroflexia bacterium SDU3-3]